MGEGGPGGADHAEDVDVQDAVPLLVGVVLDGTDGADACVVDEDVDAAQPGGRGLHGGAYRGVVADIGLETEQRPWHTGGFEVQDGHRRALRGQRAGRGEPDSCSASGDDGSET